MQEKQDSANNLLLSTLKDEAQKLSNSSLERVWNRTEMLIGKIFGKDSGYIKKLHDINFSPPFISDRTTEGDYISYFHSGKDSLIALIEVMLEDNHITEWKQSYPKEHIEEKKLGNTTSPITIFISHASEDKKWIKCLVNLLQNVFEDLPDKAIRCTSVKGYGYTTGQDFLREIKKDANHCSIVLSVLSYESLNSDMFLIESGVAWHHDKIFPVIIEEMEYEDLPYIFQSTVTHKLLEDESIHEFLTDISEKLDLTFRKPVIVNGKVTEYLEKIYELE